MTSPSGHPDYQDYANWRSGQIVSGAFSVTSIAPVQDAEYVTNYASTYVRVQLVSGTGVTVSVQYYEDSTLAIASGGYIWVLAQSNCEVRVIVPNLGNYVQVTVSTGQAGTQAGNLYVAPMNIAVTKPAYQATPNIVSGDAVSIGAGATNTTLMPYVVEGNGTVYCQCGNATTQFNIEVDHLNEGANTLDTPARYIGVTGPQLISFMASAYPILVKIVNNDSVARAFTYHAQILGN